VGLLKLTAGGKEEKKICPVKNERIKNFNKEEKR